MIDTVAVHGFRSLRDVVVNLGRITVVTGANGSGKSSLYRSLGLLAGTASGELIRTLAATGGLASVLWAGPEHVSGAMKRGEVPVEGTAGRRKPVSLMLGFAGPELGYLVDVGLPQPSLTMFARDPAVKREAIFGAPLLRPASLLVRREGGRLLVRDPDGWREAASGLPQQTSMLSEIADPHAYPDLFAVRQQVRSWRFYDSFRTDPLAPARQAHVGTWTPVLAPDGSDLAAAVQTILESSRAGAFAGAVARAFEGGGVDVTEAGGRFELRFHQHGLLRPLQAAELSDGTLRFLLLAAALCSPQPPGLLVLNEPETSLHPEVLGGLTDLIADAARGTQVMVVSHSTRIVDALADAHGDDLVHHELRRDTGETVIADQGLLTRPRWEWGHR